MKMLFPVGIFIVFFHFVPGGWVECRAGWAILKAGDSFMKSLPNGIYRSDQ
jgi:hypothetical protein